jgi:hypothetical protein
MDRLRAGGVVVENYDFWLHGSKTFLQRKDAKGAKKDRGSLRLCDLRVSSS